MQRMIQGLRALFFCPDIGLSPQAPLTEKELCAADGCQRPKHPMRSTALLTLLFALCTMVGPLGIDTYLPSFHAIALEFGVGPAAVQQTLSVYVLAMAITMLFYGTLSDTFGRQRVLIFAGCGFAITSFAAAFVQSIEALVAIRFVQGLTAGAGMVVVRAMVQDLSLIHI